ncbi:preprotein translocase subunit SecD [Halorussus litoreus]|uniref:preprotein translocase subunit SecD n=1 Tax=Halorussus litoreus TaxID=1710536 RepID=UPI000E24AEF7|nr:preprotein translocase subunit SecD [Halorussus litoreus]
MIDLRDNWRLVLLALFIFASVFALFAPGVGGGAPDAGANASAVEQGGGGPTNLQYGLELSGGTRMRAPVNGVTAEGVQIPQGTQADAVQRQVAGNLSAADLGDVNVRFTNTSTTVEAFSENVTADELGAALDAAGYEYETVRPGVTDQTRTDIVRILKDKISRAGLSGGQVQQVSTANGGDFVVIEMPNVNQSEVETLVTERGQVQVVATFPSDNQSANGTEYRRVPLLTQGDFRSVGTAQDTRGTGPHVPLTLNDEAAQEYTRAMNEYGFTSSEGIYACRRTADNPGYCLQTVVDGDVVYSADMSDGLAESLRNAAARGDSVNNFFMTTTNMSQARELQIHLQAGALPASLNMDEGTAYYLAPSLAEEFKLYSLITGLIAAVAVTVVVFLRYGDPKVAAPMLVTALSEVLILLGFAAAIRLPMDLSHIAGFIAVIGTGVDDLIIIADEVMSEGEVNSSRVFQSRFRKAFWVIGAAAATTIIAMSPLAVLSLGDLQGFAIITILGVLVGVLITRPAYGDILRSLLTDK